jgi:hypothetical protein
MRTIQHKQPPSASETQIRYVNKPTIALRYGVCLRSIENWMRTKRIPYLRIGKRGVRFSPADCDRALARFVVEEVK